MTDRIDARRLLDTDPTARALHDTIAHVYLSGQLTVAEMRAIFTLGLEWAIARETRPLYMHDPTGGKDGNK